MNVSQAPGFPTTGWPRFVPWLLALGAIGIAIYAVGVGTPYYADDYQFVFPDPGSKLLYFFFNENPTNPLYRPLQASYLALVQSLVGLNTAPIQSLQILLHVVLAGLIFRVMTVLSLTRLQAAIGSLWMLVSQANVHTVVSNDTQSQGAGTLFGCIAVWCLYRYLTTRASGGTRPALYGIGLGAFALSLWSKESSVSFLVLLGGVVLIRWISSSEPLRRLWASAMTLLPFVATTGLYLIGRSAVVSAHPRFGSDAYAFAIGPNVLVNLALFGFGATVPASSVNVAFAFAERKFVVLALLLVATLAWAALIALGLWRCSSRERRLAVVLLGFSVVALFPTILMNHVSELYLYNAMPFVSIVGGLGLGRLIAGAASQTSRALVVGLCVLAFASHAIAVTGKAAMMKREGRRASDLLQQIVPLARTVPEDGTLVLLNPAVEKPGYSSFHLPGFRVLRKGTHRINQLAGRDDFKVRVIRSEDRDRNPSPDPCVVLELKEGRVTIHSGEVDFCANVSGAPSGSGSARLRERSVS